MNSKIRTVWEVKMDYSDVSKNLEQFHDNLEASFDEENLWDPNTNKAQVILVLKSFFEVH